MLNGGTTKKTLDGGTGADKATDFTPNQGDTHDGTARAVLNQVFRPPGEDRPIGVVGIVDWPWHSPTPADKM